MWLRVSIIITWSALRTTSIRCKAFLLITGACIDTWSRNVNQTSPIHRGNVHERNIITYSECVLFSTVIMCPLKPTVTTECTWNYLSTCELLWKLLLVVLRQLVVFRLLRPTWFRLARTTAVGVFARRRCASSLHQSSTDTKTRWRH